MSFTYLNYENPVLSKEYKNTVDSVSQIGQDRLVFQLSNNKTNGFFVDLAANHYKVFSNTFYLEQNYGWDGLCIEPNPLYHQDHLQYRRCLLISSPVGHRSGSQVNFTFKGGGFAGIIDSDTDNRNSDISEAVTLETTTLLAVLTSTGAPSIIDFMSLDVEGYEYHVFSHFDFGLYRFNIMTIERPNEQLHRLLIHNGYYFLTCICQFGDIVYLSRNHANFTYFKSMYSEQRMSSCDWVKGRGYFEYNKCFADCGVY